MLDLTCTDISIGVYITADLISVDISICIGVDVRISMGTTQFNPAFLLAELIPTLRRGWVGYQW